MRYFFAFLLFFPLHAAQAGQSISISLAECSVIYNVTSISGEQNGKSPKQVSTMLYLSDIFKEDAEKQAVSEGQPNGQAYINANMPELLDKWDKRWLSASTAQLLRNMPENMEWVKYCGKLGKSRGLLPIKR